ncbi:MAG: endolytic transglycosylase MltG [Candidatus Coatesbacteria bacterium]|nr:MAG: endolytic transglycosylase MltG [Candidatus Coatesbacteria bacterium]
MSRGKKFAVVIIVSIVAGAAGTALVYAAYDYMLNKTPGAAVAKTVEIPPGSTAGEIGDLLEAEGIIADRWAFVAYVRLNKIEGELKAGRYELSSEMTVPEIADRIAAGEVALTKFTVPEGYRLTEIADAAGAAGLCSAEDFLAACEVGDPKGRIPEGMSLEGYLFPDTYVFDSGTGPEEVVAVMLDKFFDMITDEDIERIEAGGSTLHEVVTLASLVEREALVDDERPTVAAVFTNRLEKGMTLGSCATVIYALGYVPERITIQDLKIDSPYNTYINPGLPPGPICSPGEASLRAAIEPADVDYLYFVSNGDGTHTFTTTYGEHERLRLEMRERNEE